MRVFLWDAFSSEYKERKEGTPFYKFLEEKLYTFKVATNYRDNSYIKPVDISEILNDDNSSYLNPRVTDCVIKHGWIGFFSINNKKTYFYLSTEGNTFNAKLEIINERVSSFLYQIDTVFSDHLAKEAILDLNDSPNNNIYQYMNPLFDTAYKKTWEFLKKNNTNFLIKIIDWFFDKTLDLNTVKDKETVAEWYRVCSSNQNNIKIIVKGGEKIKLTALKLDGLIISRFVCRSCIYLYAGPDHSLF